MERSPPLRALIARHLRQASFPVHECVNVEDALHAMTKHGVPKAFVVSNKIGKDISAGIRFTQALATVGPLRQRPAIVLTSPRTVRAIQRELPDYAQAVPLDAELEGLIEALGMAEAQPERAANCGPRDPLWDTLEQTVRSIDDALALCREVAERVKRNELPGPMVPELLEKVRTLCARPHLQPRTLSSFIEKHQALSVRFLSMANSAYYSRGTRIRSVAQAVARIGAEPCLTLMQAIAAREYVVSKDRKLRAMISDGLERAYFVSALAKSMAEGFSTEEAEHVGLIGLFHNIGRTFLLYTFGLLQDGSGGLDLDAQGLDTITASRLFDLNRIVVKSMNLPDEINLVYAPSSVEAPPNVQVVRRAMWVADRCFEGEPRIELDAQAKLLGFDADMLHTINRRLPSFTALLREYRR